MQGFAKLDLTTLVAVIITCAILFAPAIIYANDSEKEDIHFLQEVLYLKGMYNGYIDGVAGPKTIHAVQLYKEQIGLPVTDQISDELIDMLRKEVKPILPYISPEQQNGLDSEEEFATKEELNLLKKDLDFSKTLLRDSKDSFDETRDNLEIAMGSHFISNFRELLTLLISITGIFLGIIVTVFMAWLKWYMPIFREKITTTVKQAHGEVIKHTEHSITTGVLLEISSHCINLYKDINLNKKEESDSKRSCALYDSYLQIAKNISAAGYKAAKNLEKINTELTPKDKEMINWSKNNRLFYITTPFIKKTDVIKQTEIKEIYNELNKVIKTYSKDVYDNSWWYMEETLAWAEYNMGYKDISEITEKVNCLIHNPLLSLEWRRDTYERYINHEPKHPITKISGLLEPT